MRNIRPCLAILVVAAGLATGWTPAWGAPVMPQSYEMINGGTGTYTYWDDSYTGSGNQNVSYSYLSGGLGDLTDGVIATQNWNATPGLYVGWDHGNTPVIRFHFSTAVTLNAINAYVDDANGSGGVSLPGSVRIQMGSYDNTFAVSELTGSAPKLLQFTGLNLSGTTLDLTLIRKNSWVMASEITFDGVAVPIPGAVWLMGSGLLGLVGWRRFRTS